MTEPMLPERLEQLIAGYVLGNLSSEEAEELKQFIVQNPDLSTEVSRLQEVLELMPYALPEVTPPPQLRSLILETATVRPKSQRKPNLIALPWRNIAGGIAALLILTLGISNYLLRQQLTQIEAQAAQQKDVIAMLQSPQTHLVSLKGMEMASAASGHIVMTPGEPKVVLIVRNLPVLPKGQFYQLWSVVDGEKIPSGEFNTSLQGTVFVKLSAPPNSRVTALVVTVEASPNPTSPTGPMVMASTS